MWFLNSYTKCCKKTLEKYSIDKLEIGIIEKCIQIGYKFYRGIGKEINRIDDLKIKIEEKLKDLRI